MRPAPPPEAAVTVRVAEPVMPPLEALMVAGPATRPVASPLALTVATAAALLAHVTGRPVSGLPPASFGVAVNCCVAPTAMLAVAGQEGRVGTEAEISAVAASSTKKRNPKTPL